MANQIPKLFVKITWKDINSRGFLIGHVIKSNLKVLQRKEDNKKYPFEP